MLVFSVLTAALGGLLRETADGSVSVVFFLALVIAAPLALMIGLSLVDPLLRLLERGKRK